MLGGGFYGLPVSIETRYFNGVENKKVNLGLNYGGLEFEYIFFADFPIHFSMGLLMAGGGISYNIYNSANIKTGYSTQDFLAWEPQLNIEYNALSWLHIDLNSSYRIITAYDERNNITKEDLTGLTIGLIFKFGSY